jgi:hypothetical protein
MITYQKKRHPDSIHPSLEEEVDGTLIDKLIIDAKSAG